MTSPPVISAALNLPFEKPPGALYVPPVAAVEVCGLLLDELPDDELLPFEDDDELLPDDELDPDDEPPDDEPPPDDDEPPVGRHDTEPDPPDDELLPDVPFAGAAD